MAYIYCLCKELCAYPSKRDLCGYHPEKEVVSVTPKGCCVCHIKRGVVSLSPLKELCICYSKQDFMIVNLKGTLYIRYKKGLL